MAIFNSYVKLPEGIYIYIYTYNSDFPGISSVSSHKISMEIRWMNAMRGFTKVPTQGIFEGRSVTGTTRVKPKENQNHRGFFHILACLPYDAAEIAMFFWRNLWDEFGFVAKYVGTQGDMMGPHISIYNIYNIHDMYTYIAILSP